MLMANRHMKRYPTSLIIREIQVKTTTTLHFRQIDGETMETMRDFIFLGSKVTADCDCSHVIKRCLLLGRKSMISLDIILKKQRHYFANKGLSN